MLFHPRAIRLTEYAIGEMRAAESQRLKKHLARCSRCRQAVTSTRKWIGEARSQSPADPPPGLWTRILAAAQDGRNVIIPVADPPPASTRRFGWLAVSMSGLMIIAAVAVFRVVEVRADRSELLFAVPHLLPGREMAVTYRGTGVFHDEDRLVLRARYRTIDGEPYNKIARHMIAGELRRVGRGEFEGTARLPDEAVYAVFTVEDAAGRVVDSNRQAFWELLLQEGQDPAFSALVQRANDHMGRSWQVVDESTQLMTALYPENPLSWGQRLALELVVNPAGQSDSIRAAYRPRFDELDARWTPQEHIPADVLAGMFTFARTLEALESEDTEKWKRRLLTEVPRNRFAIASAMSDVYNWENPKRNLEDLVELWARIGPHKDIAQLAFRLALRTGRDAQVLRWADRLEEANPLLGMWIAVELSASPATREVGIRRLRRQLQLLDWEFDANRPLGRTVDWQRQQTDARRREILSALGQALIVTSDREAALLALELAVEDAWNVQVFATLARARMAVGDTIGATEVTAAVVVDPTTAPAVRDSLTRGALELVDQPSWMAMQTTARESMYAHVLESAVTIRVPSDVRVYDALGQQRSWHDLVSGRVTVVGTVSRYGFGLDRLTDLHEALTETFGTQVQMIGLFSDGQSPVGGSAPTQLDAPFPIVENSSGDLRGVLNWWGIPTFFVLDATGLVRFARSADDDVLRQVATLLALEGQPIVADDSPRPNQP